jgi:hypothetical protein
MSSHRARYPVLFLPIAVLVAVAMVSIAKAQIPTPQPAAPAPIRSAVPSPTPPLEARLDVLESQVADLREGIGMSRFKDILGIVEIFVTIIAIIIGGIWGYWLFVQNRQKYPRASIVHCISHRHIGSDKLLLHVNATISNVGEVLLSLIHLETRVQQVVPLADDVLDLVSTGENLVPEGETEVAWPLIALHEVRLERGKCEVEPGESQEIHHDFILDTEVKTVEVYTYLINEKKRDHEIAWDLTTLYDIDEVQVIKE